MYFNYFLDSKAEIATNCSMKQILLLVSVIVYCGKGNAPCVMYKINIQ